MRQLNTWRFSNRKSDNNNNEEIIKVQSEEMNRFKQERETEQAEPVQARLKVPLASPPARRNQAGEFALISYPINAD